VKNSITWIDQCVRIEVAVKATMLLWPILLLLVVFWEPLTTSRTLFHPDWAPFFEAGSGQGFWRTFVEIGQVPSFMYFLWALLPDRLFHVLFYPIITFAIYAVLYVFFRNRNLPRAAAMAGALAGAFSGYLLTLVSAGHRGVSEAMLSSVIILLCIDRIVRGGGIWYGIAAALATAFTLGTQPDVLGLIGLFLAAYAVMACWTNRQTILAGKRRFGSTLLVAGLVFAVTVPPAVQTIRDAFLPGREAQIAGSVAGGDQAVSAAQRWEFTTNWSLPPADMPELILPLFFGTETSDRTAPFWGELGRTLGWEPGRPGFRNYRQHTIYIGLLQVLLAFFACGCVLNRKCRQVVVATGEEKRQILFWSICGIVALSLSLGRYAPFYRAFYALPFAQAIRAPIKILHVVNLAVAILAAYGVTFLLRALPQGSQQPETVATARKAAKWLAICCGCLAASLVFAVLITHLASVPLTAYWFQLGFDAGFHPTMRHHMLLALWRSTGMAAGLGACIWFLILRKGHAWSATALGVILCTAIGLDMAVTAKRFVNTVDLSVHESRNAIVEDIKAPIAPRVMDLLTSRQQNDPLRVNLEWYHAGSIRLMDADLSSNGKLLSMVGNDFGKLIRLLQITGTEFVVGTREQLAPWLKHELFEQAGQYDFANRIIKADANRSGRILLLRLKQTLPRAAWMPSARSTDADSMVNAVFETAFNPWKEVLVARSSEAWIGGEERKEGSGVSAKVTAWSRWRVVVEDVPPEGGILLLNEPYHHDWKAYADGQPIQMATANGAMMTAHVPAATSQIEFLRRPGLRFFWVSTVPAALFALAVLIVALRHVWRKL